jgi:hypothetical protein
VAQISGTWEITEALSFGIPFLFPAILRYH